MKKKSAIIVALVLLCFLIMIFLNDSTDENDTEISNPIVTENVVVGNYDDGKQTQEDYNQDENIPIEKDNIVDDSNVIFDDKKENKPTTNDTSNIVNKKYINIVFDSLGGSSVDKQTILSNTKVVEPKRPIKIGYTFGGWYNDINLNNKFNFGNNVFKDATLFAKWVPNKDTKYTVNHYQMDVKGEGYKLIKIETLKGETDSFVNPKTYEFKGFTSPVLQTVKIKPDGSTVIDYKYTRNKYVLNMKHDDGIESTTGNGEYYFEEEVSLNAIPKKGYKTASFINNENEENIQELTFKMPDKNSNIFVKSKLIEYKIILDLDGGSFDEGIKIPKTYNVITEDIKLDNPKKEGFTFIGWKEYESDVLNKNVVIKKGSIGDKLYKANWKINSYTVIFDSNGGSNCENIITDYGSELGELPIPTKEGHTFKGWYTLKDDGEKISSTTRMPLGGATYYARWERNSYKLFFETNGGVLEGESSKILYFGEKYGALPIPTKEGYTFKGWYTSDYEGTKVTENTVMTSDNVTIFAKWDINSCNYNIVYESSTGKVLDTSSIIGDFGTSKEIFAPNKEGYKTPDPKVINFNKNHDEIKFIYEPIIYSIKYDLDGGKGENKDTYTIESDSIKLITPTKEGSDFIGWTGSNGDNPQISVEIKQGSTGNLAYKANWRSNEVLYSVEYVSSTGLPLGQSVVKGKFGTTTVLEAPEKKGYELPNSQTIKFDTMESKTIIFEYNIIDYKITYKLDGGSIDNDLSTYNVEDELIFAPVAVKEGHTFIGWTLNQENKPKLEIIIPKGTTGDKTYIANYKANFYILTFDANGGNVSQTNKEVVYGYEYGELPTPTKEGYKFLGWYTTKDGDNKIESTDVFENSANSTVYAKWEPQKLKYEIKYLSSSGKLLGVSSVIGDYGDDKIIEAPYKDGYVTPKPQNIYFDSENKIVEFKFDLINYTVEYDLNGADYIENVDTYNIESETININNPRKKGFKFIGWKNEVSGEVSTNMTIEKGSTGDKKFIAQFKENEYKINHSSINIEKGFAKNLSIENLEIEDKVIWESSNNNIAKVTDSGNVIAKSKGNVTITAKIYDKELKCSVFVEDSGVEPKESNINLKIGDTYQAVLNNAKADEIKWTSSNELIATVDEKGLITGKGVGSAKISITYGFNKYEISVKINEKDIIEDSPLITRGEWIQSLSEIIGMKPLENLKEEEYNYKDTFNSKYGLIAETALYSEIILNPNVAEEFDENGFVTREFAVMTAINASRISLDKNSTIDNGEYFEFPNHVSKAIELNFIRFDNNNRIHPEEFITFNEAKYIYNVLGNIIKVQDNDKLHNSEIIVYYDDVVEYDLNNKVDFNVIDNGYNLTVDINDVTFNIGDIVIFKTSSTYYPAKIENIIVDNDIAKITCSIPDIYEYVKYIDYSKNTTPKVDFNKITLNEGVSVVKNTMPTTFTNIDGNVEIEDPYSVTYEITYESKEGGNEFKLTGFVEHSIYNLMLQLNANTSLTEIFDIELFSVEINQSIKSNVKVEASSEGKYKIATVPIPLTPFGINIDLYLYWDVNGKVWLGWEPELRTGFEYRNNNFRIYNKLKNQFDTVNNSSLNISSELKGEIGPEVIADFNLFNSLGLLGIDLRGGIITTINKDIYPLISMGCANIKLDGSLNFKLDKETAIGFLLKVIDPSLLSNVDILKLVGVNPNFYNRHSESIDGGKYEEVPECTYGYGKLEGYIYDEQNLPLQNAKVFVNNKNTNDTYETTTDKNGYFAIEPIKPGSYNGIIKLDGYEDSSIPNDTYIVKKKTTTIDKITMSSIKDIVIEGNATFSDGTTLTWEDLKLQENGVKYGYDASLITDIAIEKSAFQNCENIVSIEIPEGITTIGQWAFFDCLNLSHIKLPSTLTYIGHAAFVENDIVEIKIPDSVSFLGQYAFSHCYKLEKVNIPVSIDTIQIYTFQYTNIKEIIIPNNVKQISQMSFCTKKLEKIYIPSSVTSIPTGEGSSYAGGWHAAGGPFYGNVKVYLENDYIPGGWGSLWNEGVSQVVYGATLEDYHNNK